MARPPLAIGTHGSMKAKYRADRKVWVAHTRFRDFDGVTRLVQRVGRSQTAALAALQDDIRKRIGSPANPLRPTDTFERAANLWLAKLDAQVAEGARAATTADTYRQRLHSVILPAMGQWRLRECAVPRLDAFFTGLAATQGAQSRKTVRTVVSLILRLAVQHEAIVDNPVRHLDPMDPLSRWTTRPQSRISWSRSPRTCSGAGPVAARPDVPPDTSGSTSKRPRVSGRPQPRVHRSPGGLPAFQEDQGR
jgi:hypothetical protein